MEYNAVNLSLPGEKQARVPHVDARPLRLLGHRIRLREFAPEQENAELARIAERSTEPTLAFMADDTLLLQRPRSSGQHVRPGCGSAGLRRPPAEARARVVAVDGVALDGARRFVCAAAAEFFPRAVRSPAERDVRGQVHRRPHAAIGPCGQRSRAARTGPRGQAARGAETARRNDIRRRQLPVSSVVPASAGGQRRRHRRRPRSRTQACRRSTSPWTSRC